MNDWDKGSKGPIPNRWLHCPRKSAKLVNQKFLAFKTPLSSDYDNQVSEDCRFNIEMLLSSLKSQRLKMGLWIDLTNTSRFYDKKEVEKHGVRYLKLQCRGHGETPSPEQTKTFVQVCKTFIAHNPLEIIGVHCTHGFNRTGFLIVSYLVETDVCSLDASLAIFADARPPGIYKEDYLQELYKRYDDIEDTPNPPARPAWCLEYDDSNVQDQDGNDDYSATDSLESGQKKRRKENFNQNPIFMAGIPGVKPILDAQKAYGIQRRVQDMCEWKSSGFPGSQPVTLDFNNLPLLHDKLYKVSWKADGTRYMMLIQGDGNVFFIDRDNSVFKVENLTFPHVRDHHRILRDTLLDGEMVIDKCQGKEYPRYLVYDVIMYDGKDVKNLYFYPDRYQIIENQIIEGRKRAMMERRLIREREPFSVRLKEFWPLNKAEKLLGSDFAKKLTHKPDGLIFQPAHEPYKTGQSPEVLKWKPPSLNSVDFQLKIVLENKPGILPTKIGELYVGGLDRPFATIQLTKQLREVDGKIIECKCDNGKWLFMRERTDKSFPNSWNTAQSVFESIKNPVTSKKLLDYIFFNRFPDDQELMPPPPKKLHV